MRCQIQAATLRRTIRVPSASTGGRTSLSARAVILCAEACLSKCLDNSVLSQKLDTGKKVVTCPVCRQPVHDPEATWTVRHAKKVKVDGEVAGFNMEDRAGLNLSDAVAYTPR